jgi:hypothetical protein
MAKHYVHSELMQALKQTKETIQENYSSAQYTQVWDELLFNALSPILTCTNIADIILADVLHFYVENHRRKVSTLNKEDALTNFFLFLACPISSKEKRLKSLKLERNVLNIIIKTFLDKTKNYQELTTKLAKKTDPLIQEKIKEVEIRIGYTGYHDLYSVISTVRFWFDQANKFRNQILEKYLRLIVVEAQAYYKTNNSNMKLNDIIQNLVMFTLKALDKYDSDKGTLSTYIQQWLHHGKNMSAVQESGIAFLLPTNKRSEEQNISVSIDSEEVLQIEDENSTIDLDSLYIQRRVQLLAKIADPIGLGRVSLGISEVLSKQEKMLLLNSVKSNSNAIKERL